MKMAETQIFIVLAVPAVLLAISLALEFYLCANSILFLILKITSKICKSWGVSHPILAVIHSIGYFISCNSLFVLFEGKLDIILV